METSANTIVFKGIESEIKNFEISDDMFFILYKSGTLRKYNSLSHFLHEYFVANQSIDSFLIYREKHNLITTNYQNSIIIIWDLQKNSILKTHTFLFKPITTIILFQGDIIFSSFDRVASIIRFNLESDNLQQICHDYPYKITSICATEFGILFGDEKGNLNFIPIINPDKYILLGSYYRQIINVLIINRGLVTLTDNKELIWNHINELNRSIISVEKTPLYYNSKVHSFIKDNERLIICEENGSSQFCFSSVSLGPNGFETSKIFFSTYINLYCEKMVLRQNVIYFFQKNDENLHYIQQDQKEIKQFGVEKFTGKKIIATIDSNLMFFTNQAIYKLNLKPSLPLELIKKYDGISHVYIHNSNIYLLHWDYRYALCITKIDGKTYKIIKNFEIGDYTINDMAIDDLNLYIYTTKKRILVIDLKDIDQKTEKTDDFEKITVRYKKSLLKTESAVCIWKNFHYILEISGILSQIDFNTRKVNWQKKITTQIPSYQRYPLIGVENKIIFKYKELEIVILNGETGEKICVLKDHKTPIQDIFYSDGILTSISIEEIKLWSLTEFNCIYTGSCPKGFKYGLMRNHLNIFYFTPDSELIIITLPEEILNLRSI